MRADSIVGTRPARMGTLVSLSLFIACVVWVYLRLMKRYRGGLKRTQGTPQTGPPSGVLSVFSELQR